EGAEQPARRNDGAKQFRFEPFRSEIGHCHRSPTKEAKSVLFGETAKPQSDSAEIPKVAFRRFAERGWRQRHQGRKHLADYGETRNESWVRLAIVLRYCPQFAGRSVGFR